MCQAFSVRDRDGNAYVLALKEVTPLGGKAVIWMLLMAAVCRGLTLPQGAILPALPMTLCHPINNTHERRVFSSIHWRDEKMSGRKGKQAKVIQLVSGGLGSLSAETSNIIYGAPTVYHRVSARTCAVSQSLKC